MQDHQWFHYRYRSVTQGGLAFLMGAFFLAIASAEEVVPEETTEEVEEVFKPNEASLFTQREARTMTLSIPAPRGLILDRDGKPLAQSKVVYYLALDFTQLGPVDDVDAAVLWAQEVIEQANELTGDETSLSDRKLRRYYKNRRWIPRVISQVFDEKKAKALQEKLTDGLTILPVYQRFYPQKKSAGHLVGYVATRKALDDGPIAYGDPIFKSVEGRNGFEMVFDDELRGVPGLKKIIFNKDGEKVVDEMIRRPQPGGTVVTTLDLDWQQHAESVLQSGTRRGALVVIDVRNGDVVAMASKPSYDPNEFIPYITTERYKELSEDPSAPLFARAYQSAYPPASTFKPIVAIAAITNGVITKDSRIDSPYKIKIGSKWFRNHSKGNLGKINLNTALARSANPYFYRLGIMTGPQAFLSVARRLGFGTRTGLPLVGETPGMAPTPEDVFEKNGRPTTDGDTANMAIGQGDVTASPLQVAQAMAGIAHGQMLLQLRLVKQIQDFHGRVIEAPTAQKRNDLSFSEAAREAVIQGMRNVVHADYGTAKRAALGFTVMCGKTGTAEWIQAKDQRLAWFAGFFPPENPRYAFAVVYEGKPGQVVSGGRQAAPLIKRFFSRFKGEVLEAIKPPPRAMVIVEEEEDEVAAAEPVEEIPTAGRVDELTLPEVGPGSLEIDENELAVPAAEGGPTERPEVPTTE